MLCSVDKKLYWVFPRPGVSCAAAGSRQKGVFGSQQWDRKTGLPPPLQTCKMRLILNINFTFIFQSYLLVILINFAFEPVSGHANAMKKKEKVDVSCSNTAHILSSDRFEKF